MSRSWLQSIVARSVCWRVSAVRRPAPSTSRLSPRRAAIWSSDSAAARAAASSMASGMPSRRRQISATAPAASSAGSKPGRAAAARSQNSRSASASEGTRQATSSAQRSGSRLVARTRTPGPARRTSSARRAHASIRCSQLSRTINASRVARCATSASRAERDAGIGTPTASAAACATSAGSLRLARSTNQAPSGSSRQRVGGDLERQPRLAAAPGAGERHKPGALQQARDVGALALTADERGQLAREVATPRRRGRRRRQQLLVERASRGVRLGRQLGVEALAQKLVLGQRLLATARARVQAHERAVSRLRERVGDQRPLQGDHGGRRVAMQLGELEAQLGVQLGERSAPRVRPRLVTVLGQQRAAVKAERALIGGRVAIGSRARRSSLESINVDLSIEDDGAVYQRQRGRAVGARGVERAAGGIERLVQVVRGCVGVAVGPQQLSEALAVHAAVGRQREDLDQRLGLAQPPRAISDDAVADGDRKTAQEADARLGAVARGSPLPDEPNASTRGRRARPRSPRAGAARGPRPRRTSHRDTLVPVEGAGVRTHEHLVAVRTTRGHPRCLDGR